MLNLVHVLFTIDCKFCDTVSGCMHSVQSVVFALITKTNIDWQIQREDGGKEREREREREREKGCKWPTHMLCYKEFEPHPLQCRNCAKGITGDCFSQEVFTDSYTHQWNIVYMQNYTSSNKHFIKFNIYQTDIVLYHNT